MKVAFLALAAAIAAILVGVTVVVVMPPPRVLPSESSEFEWCQCQGRCEVTSASSDCTKPQCDPQCQCVCLNGQGWCHCEPNCRVVYDGCDPATAHKPQCYGVACNCQCK